VRIPAALCGIVGLKAGYGIISRYGMVPPIPPNQDHAPGILGRTVEDVALVLQAVAGRDEHDPVSRDFDVPDYASGLDRDLRGLRVGVPTNFYFDHVDIEVEQAVRKAAETLAGLGMEIEDVRIPFLDEAMAVTFVGGLPDFHRKALQERRQDYGEDIRYRLMAAAFTLASDAARAQRIADIFKASMANIMARYDVLIAPTTRMPAYEFDAGSLQLGGTTFNLQEPLVPSVVGTGLTRPSNMSGNPALSIPCGSTTSGLPIGLQIIGRPLGEPTVLAIAHQFAASSGIQAKVPPRPDEAMVTR
jgi:aspartyl-tRNA(Asn)/glutamyl-tRNA(Gln) amidotransferase subunit A